MDWLDVAQAEDGRNLELPVITSIWQGHGSRISTSVGLSTGHLPTESQTLVYIYIYNLRKAAGHAACVERFLRILFDLDSCPQEDRNGAQRSRLDADRCDHHLMC